jgi:hypothetical protein
MFSGLIYVHMDTWAACHLDCHSTEGLHPRGGRGTQKYTKIFFIKSEKGAVGRYPQGSGFFGRIRNYCFETGFSSEMGNFCFLNITIPVYRYKKGVNQEFKSSILLVEFQFQHRKHLLKV